MKRVLLDENVDRRLKRFFDSEFEVSTVTEEGWHGLANGRLLSEASSRFDVLVTMDSNIPHQQNLESQSMAIILVRAKSNRRDEIEPLMPKINAAVKSAAAGQLAIVE